ncbi:GTPase-activating Rap/Ran-GAP domain-like protein 3 [Homalodisca vitripennis]|nr:GTPase-activating Rap/Ran-GAP domain-like protein 3 [Homalodisca vitripennis]
MTLVDSSLAGTGTGDNMICVGYRNQYDVVNERLGDCTHLFTVQDSTKGHLVAAIDLYEDEEPELLLCYNNTCHFQKLAVTSPSSTEFDFHWNSIPSRIVCAFPYILAFTSDSMEIRLIINGNLVQHTTMPRLTLICSKNDIFFATTAPEFFQTRAERLHVDHRIDRDPSISPPSSPHCTRSRRFRPSTTNTTLGAHGGIVQSRTEVDLKLTDFDKDKREAIVSLPRKMLVKYTAGNDCQHQKSMSPESRPFRLYRISLTALSGLIAPCDRRCPTPSPEPSVGTPDSAAEKPKPYLLTAEPARGLSRSCSSSPTPQPSTN